MRCRIKGSARTGRCSDAVCQLLSDAPSEIRNAVPVVDLQQVVEHGFVVRWDYPHQGVVGVGSNENGHGKVLVAADPVADEVCGAVAVAARGVDVESDGEVVDAAVCAVLPAAVPLAWAAAAACPSDPSWLVVCGGFANGVTTDAAAEEAA